MVTPLMDLDLGNIIKIQKLTDDQVKFIIYQIMRGLKYIHSAGIIHRDLKPSNLAVNEDCDLKILDFGLARPTDAEMTGYVATRWYRAPEILLASKKYTAGVDMWSLGCILAEMLLGKPLFPGSSTINQIEKIVATVPLPQGREINEICSDYAQSILDKANTVAKRPLKEFLPDATSEAFSLVELLLKFNPSKRLTAHSGLRHPYVARFHNTAQVDISAN